MSVHRGEVDRIILCITVHGAPGDPDGGIGFYGPNGPLLDGEFVLRALKLYLAQRCVEIPLADIVAAGLGESDDITIAERDEP
jgi:hypothetical protein